MDWSAVRFAWREVTPKVIPNTATTSSAEARKIFAVSPSAGLIALEPCIGRILAAVLVLVGLPAVAARIEGDLHVPPPHAGCRDGHVVDDFGGDPLVPHVQAI